MTTQPRRSIRRDSSLDASATGAPAPSSVAAEPCRRATDARRRRRRPSGAPPPLPRSIGRTGRGWIVGLVVLVAWLVVALVSPWARRLTDQVDAVDPARRRPRSAPAWLTTLARGVDRVATGWTMFVVAIVLLVATVVFKRWRHLFTFLGSVHRARGARHPADRRVPAAPALRRHDIGRWQGFSLPSATAAVVSFTVVGIIYMLVVPGRPRRDRQGRRHRRRRGLSSRRGSTSASTTPSTSSPASPSAWPSRSTPSASSPRTRSSR